VTICVLTVSRSGRSAIASAALPTKAVPSTTPPLKESGGFLVFLIQSRRILAAPMAFSSGATAMPQRPDSAPPRSMPMSANARRARRLRTTR
jgi:hypothetical protein